MSSFTADDLDPARLNSIGAKRLRSYLQYAQSGGRDFGEDAPAARPMNAFEIHVHDRLTAAGMSLIPQYGVSGYFLDFAVRHPTEPGRMIMAIETDGATYHSAETARARDRLRQEHLERLGWRFHRIWSRAWFTDPTTETRRAVPACEAALLDADRHTPSAPTAVPRQARRAAPTPSARSGDCPVAPRLPIKEYATRN